LTITKQKNTTYWHPSLSRQSVALVLTIKTSKQISTSRWTQKRNRKTCPSSQNKQSPGLVCSSQPLARKRSMPYSDTPGTYMGGVGKDN